MQLGVNTRIDDLRSVINQTKDHRLRMMQNIAKNVVNWLVKVSFTTPSLGEIKSISSCTEKNMKKLGSSGQVKMLRKNNICEKYHFEPQSVIFAW